MFGPVRGIDSLKQKLTSRFDRIPGMYSRETKSVPRQCVFVGTTNKTKFLPDDEENRRFVPLYVKRLFDCDKCRDLDIRCIACEKPTYKAIETFMNDNREQLWAEAIHLWKSGYSLVEPDHITEILQAKREVAKEVNFDLQEAVHGAVLHLKEGGEPQNITKHTNKEGAVVEKGRIRTFKDGGLYHFRISDLMDCMGEAHVRYRNVSHAYYQTQIAQVLREAGFKSQRKRLLKIRASWWWYEESFSPLDVKF